MNFERALHPWTRRRPERATSRRAAGPNAIGDLGRVPARAGCRSCCDRGPVALQRRVHGQGTHFGGAGRIHSMVSVWQALEELSLSPGERAGVGERLIAPNVAIAKIGFRN